MPAQSGKASKGGPHDAGQSTKVYDHRSNGEPVGEPKTSGNKVRGKHTVTTE